MNRRIRIGRTEQTIITFLDRANVRVHDAVLSKFLNVFFATLPECNALSLCSNRAKAEKQDFGRKVDKDSPFYEEGQYLEALSAVSATSRPEILTACSNACQNVLTFNSPAPILPDISGNSHISMYFLGFIILKESWIMGIFIYYCV